MKPNPKPKAAPPRRLPTLARLARRARGTSVLVGSTLVALPVVAQDVGRVDKLEKENLELRQRLEALENVAQKEGLLPSGQPAPKFVKALSEISLSGFVQASYFYNTQEPVDKNSDGYLWNTVHDSFSLNKFKMTLASQPSERSGETWDTGFRVSMMWGEDASILNTGGERQGLEALREAYIDLNVPIGDGLIVKAGQLISLLNFESGDGGAANPNFSQGFQWFFTGNGPSTGVQADYQFTDWLNVKARVQNGLYAGAVDNNDAKTVLGSIGLTPDDKTWVNLLGFIGEESPTLNVSGASVLAGRKFGSKLNTGLELDYFNFEAANGNDAALWSIGGWVWYDFTTKIGAAVRAEYLDDREGAGLKGINFPGRPGSAILSPDVDGTVTSVALTFNIRPLPSVKIQPEVRYDRTSYTGGFDGEEDRFIVGAGVTYSF
ncbi:MAG: outer membrane beta-barrel protein [Verrucomicrobiales bacterium]|nr:outer membrane beta-barrel protein [Verrucomicrobiales bacterium]